MAQKYHEILNDPEIISWSKLHLKKSDRIVWYLKQVKNDANIHPSEELKHFYAMNIPKINNFTIPASLVINEVTALFKAIEENYLKVIKEDTDLVLPSDSEEIILSMDKYHWVNLHKSFCPSEGKAMQHCGNDGSDDNETLLSLREKVTRAGIEVWRPHLTFILDLDTHTLIEMKGKQNSKPSEKYHDYILELLKLPLIKKITGNERYLPKNNFQLQDLPHGKLVEFLSLYPSKINEQLVPLALSGGSAKEFNKLSFEEVEEIRLALTWVKDLNQIHQMAETNNSEEVLSEIIRIKEVPDHTRLLIYNRELVRGTRVLESIKDDTIREQVFFNNVCKPIDLDSMPMYNWFSWVRGQKSSFLVEQLPAVKDPMIRYHMACEIDDIQILESLFKDENEVEKVRVESFNKLSYALEETDRFLELLSPDLPLTFYDRIASGMQRNRKEINNKIFEVIEHMPREKGIALNLMMIYGNLMYLDNIHFSHNNFCKDPLVELLIQHAKDIYLFKRHGEAMPQSVGSPEFKKLHELLARRLLQEDEYLCFIDSALLFFMTDIEFINSLVPQIKHPGLRNLTASEVRNFKSLSKESSVTE